MILTQPLNNLETPIRVISKECKCQRRSKELQIGKKHKEEIELDETQMSEEGFENKEVDNSNSRDEHQMS